MFSFLYTQSPAAKPPLRIGVLLDSPHVARSFAAMMDHIHESNFARVELLIYQKATRYHSTEPAPQRSFVQKLSDTFLLPERRKKLGFTLYLKWDMQNINPANDPMESVDYSHVFNKIDSIDVVPEAKRFVHRFPPEAIEAIRAKNLDVLIRGGFNILRGDILTAAKYGIWSYHHSDNDFIKGSPPDFWELVENNPVSGVILQQLTEAIDAGKVLCKGYFATAPGLSQFRNRVQPFWGASTFMIQKLRELHEHGWEHIDRRCIPPAPYRGKRKMYLNPSNGDILRWFPGAWARTKWNELVQPPVVDHWRTAIRTAKTPLLEDTNDFRWTDSPKERAFLEPCLLESDGRVWVFFQDFDYATGRGSISAAEIQNGALGIAVRVLERPYHLGHPCVFRDGESIYMIPASGNENVDLYRCVRFPDQWELVKTLLPVNTAGTAVWIEDGKYWFFVTLKEPYGGAVQLWLFSSTSITGEWKPHPGCPLSTDVRSSGGAGAIFRHGGKLYRPSQDSSGHPGWSFTLNEIVTLNAQEYAEKPARTIEPIWAPDLVATHAYARGGDVEVIDGCTPLPPDRVKG